MPGAINDISRGDPRRDKNEISVTLLEWPSLLIFVAISYTYAC